MAFSQENDVILIKLEGTGDPTVYVPPASHVVRGIASFKDTDFIVDEGRVEINPERINEFIDPELDKKVDKIHATASHPRAYVVNENGSQSESGVEITTDLVIGTIPMRDGNGVFGVGEPTDGAHPATKSYVDGKDNTKQDKRPNGTKDLIENGKVSTVYLPDAILGALQFQSTWSPAYNLPELTATPEPKGYFWICTDDGSRFGLDFHTGDWLLSLETEWAKVDNTDAVSSVNDKTGAVVLQVNDIVGLRAELDKINYDDRLLTENGETILTEDGLALIIDYLKVVAGLDKVGIAQANIDLSDMADAVFGTLETPIEIYEDSVITFNNYQPVAGYQRAFILYIRRHANVEDVDWAGVVKWANGEKPLLPIGKIQRVQIITYDGINFYGVGGIVFNV